MLNSKANHLSDPEILQLVDGEMPALRASDAKLHVADCPDCHARQVYLQSSLAEMVDLLNPVSDSPLPDGSRARQQLKAQLLHAAPPSRVGWLKRLEIAFHAQPRGFVYAELAVMVLAVCAFSWREFSSARELTASRYEVAPEPNHLLTPGATRPVTLADICPLDDDDLDPDVAPSKRQEVFRNYGISTRAFGKDYQVDYLINPQLGGTDDIRNLWPEPYTTIWNARAKDTLEKRLHQMVCERQLDLESAQRDIASDWIAAYKKYFHSERPV